MKKVISLLFFFSLSLSAAEFCPIQSQSDVITKLAKELEATCDWSIRELATEAVINDCSRAKKKDSSIRFRTENGKKEIHFTKYGDTYNHQEANIECKHNKAYQARVNHMIKRLEHEAYVAQRAQAQTTRSTTTSGRSGTSSSPRPAPRPEKKQLWSCRVPNYIRTYRIVEESEKVTLENTYNTVCTPYN